LHNRVFIPDLGTWKDCREALVPDMIPSGSSTNADND